MPDGFERRSVRFGDVPSWFKSPQLLEEICDFSSNLDNVQLAGGEPLINPVATQWIDYLCQTGLVKKIHLTMFTNFTKATPQLLDKLAQFKTFNLIMSIDATEKVYEWIRYPAQWRAIEENVRMLREHPMFSARSFHPSLNVTISAYNMLSLEEISDWAFDCGLDLRMGIVSGPPYVSPIYFPGSWELMKEQVDRIAEKATREGRFFSCEQLEGTAWSPTEAECKKHLDLFVRFTKELEATRSVKFKDNCPKLFGYWKKVFGDWPG